MNLALDIGNTAVKWATFEGRTMTDSGHGLPTDLMAAADEVLAAASGNAEVLQAVAAEVSLLDTDTRLPIQVAYRTPQTLGADRVADACGAWAMHGGDPCVIIDAGTCITVDFIDGAGMYHGGAIMPGIRMNLQALHTFTVKLPLLDIKNDAKAPILGRTTEESILSGTLGATLLALAGYVACYRAKAPATRVLVTGGDMALLGGQGDNDWECVPDLALRGLNEIMIYNK